MISESDDATDRSPPPRGPRPSFVDAPRERNQLGWPTLDFGFPRSPARSAKPLKLFGPPSVPLSFLPLLTRSMLYLPELPLSLSLPLTEVGTNQLCRAASSPLPLLLSPLTRTRSVSGWSKGNFHAENRDSRVEPRNLGKQASPTLTWVLTSMIGPENHM